MPVYRLVPIAAADDPNWDRAVNHGEIVVRAASSGVVTRAYWITERGVAVRRVTLICSRSIMSPTRGLISFFQ